MVLGNLVARLGKSAKAQFFFNLLALSLLIIDIAMLLVSGYSGVILNTFSFNQFSLFFSLIFTAGLFVVNLVAFDYSEGYQDFALISDFSLLGMYVVASSVSLITVFLGKFLLFLSAVNANLVWLAIIGIINTAISVFYYARAVIAIYTKRSGAHPMVLGTPLEVVVLICLAITLVFGIYPQLVVNLTNAAAAYLFSVV